MLELIYMTNLIYFDCSLSAFYNVAPRMAGSRGDMGHTDDQTRRKHKGKKTEIKQKILIFCFTGTYRLTFNPPFQVLFWSDFCHDYVMDR